MECSSLVKNLACGVLVIIALLMLIYIVIDIYRAMRGK